MPEVLRPKQKEKDIKNQEIAIVGGGPAGAFCGYLFAQSGAKVTIIEPRSSVMGKKTPCTGCAGIIQPEVIEVLRKEGLIIPEDIIQSTLYDGTVIHLPNSSRIEVEPNDQPVKTVFRGFAPVRAGEGCLDTQSFDAWLLEQAIKAGATHIQQKADGIDLNRIEKRVSVTVGETKIQSDFLVAAYGHSNVPILYPTSVEPVGRPTSVKSVVREYYLGEKTVQTLIGDSMHVFGNPTEDIWFALVVPKGQYITVTLMGRNNITQAEYAKFLQSNTFMRLVKQDLTNCRANCACAPSITLKSPKKYIVSDKEGISMIELGDAGPSRPRKNGMFAAIDSARTLYHMLRSYGCTTEALEKYKKYIDRTYVWDNEFTDFILYLVDKVLDEPVLSQTVEYVSNGHVPVLTVIFKSFINYITSGRLPYWNIPMAVLRDLLLK